MFLNGYKIVLMGLWDRTEDICKQQNNMINYWSRSIGFPSMGAVEV